MSGNNTRTKYQIVYVLVYIHIRQTRLEVDITCMSLIWEGSYYMYHTFRDFSRTNILMHNWLRKYKYLLIKSFLMMYHVTICLWKWLYFYIRWSSYPHSNQIWILLFMTSPMICPIENWSCYCTSARDDFFIVLLKTFPIRDEVIWTTVYIMILYPDHSRPAPPHDDLSSIYKFYYSYTFSWKFTWGPSKHLD